MFMLTVKKRINKREKRMKGDYYSLGDFPGSPVVRATHFHCRGNQGWILGQRTKICLVTQSKKKEKQELLIHAATWINLTK